MAHGLMLSQIRRLQDNEGFTLYKCGDSLRFRLSFVDLSLSGSLVL